MNSEIVESFAQIARDKNIDKDTLAAIVEDIFMKMIEKKYFTTENFSVIVNMDKGDIQIIQIVEVVEDVFCDVDEIDIEDAIKIDPDVELGDEFAKEIPLSELGRRLIIQAKQTLNQRIREIEKENIIKEYAQYIGDIMVGEVYQFRKNEVLINHNKVELILPRDEQIYKDRFRKGDTIRTVLIRVERGNSNNPKLIVSRKDNKFLARLFEIEVPEIYDGLVSIKAIARDPGNRAKIAVESNDDRVDAVGACVGMKGVRIHSIVKELNSENIDVVLYSSDPKLFIARSLAPAKVLKVEFTDKPNHQGENVKTAIVHVNVDQVSLAVGKDGQNVKLASQLTGFNIEIYREIDDGDVDIMEFSDVFEVGFLQQLMNAGYDSAKKILKVGADDIADETGLELSEIERLIVEIEEEFSEGE